MTPRQRKHRDRMRRLKQKRQAGSWQTLETPKKRRPHNAAATAPKPPEPPRAAPVVRRRSPVRGLMLSLLLLSAVGGER